MSDAHILATFLAELVVLMVLGRALGEVMARFGQPAIFGQLLAGVALGPSLFGLVLPGLHDLIFPQSNKLKTMIDAVSQVGILLLLLLTGMETNIQLVRRRFRVVATTSVSGIAVPFVCGLALGYFLPDSLIPDEGRRLVTALFIGTALSISSVKIVAVVLMEVGFIRRDLGQLILATAILDDSIAWIIVSVIAGMASREALDLTRIGFSVGAAVLFLAVALTLGRRLVAELIRWTNDTLAIDFPVITAVLAVTFAMALTTDLIGVHSALGAFVAGVIIGQSPILKGHIEQELRGLILAFFSPVFFAVAGLEMDLTTIATPSMLGLALLFVLIASVGKTAGALAGGHLAGLSWRESTALATGLNARGSTEVIIATIGMSLGVLSEPLYTLIVAMAILTTMAMPPTLRWTLSRVETRPDEQERMEEEEAEAGDILPAMERALLIAEAGANGEMAARLAGAFAAERQMLTTSLEPAAGTKGSGAKGSGTKGNEAEADTAETGAETEGKGDTVALDGTGLARAAAKDAAARIEAARNGTPRTRQGEKTAEAAPKTTDPETAGPSTAGPKAAGPKAAGPKAAEPEAKGTPAKAPRDKDAPPRIGPDALIKRTGISVGTPPQEVAAKGYGILFCGLPAPFDADGHHLVPPLKDILDATDMPAVIALAQGRPETPGGAPPGHILVPIDGTQVSQLASEIAVALAHAMGARLTFLHVVEQENESTLRRGIHSAGAGSILQQADVLARRHTVVPELREVVDRQPHRLIRRLAARGTYDLIVFGADLRQDGGKFLGPRSAGLVQSLAIPALVVTD
ncbi:cation:proton antiporter domain-containing protein [Acidimangrovimonas sediminis]|uniref:cation:proton antiporter domain-containing protein n=1 Tax=Acidimangrovimonas sediminis TaxID=2056283 RepID=UPI000C7F7B11|nr:cation:proton antiporter [Acidimangrovimonas sediminis]